MSEEIKDSELETQMSLLAVNIHKAVGNLRSIVQRIAEMQLVSCSAISDTGAVVDNVVNMVNAMETPAVAPAPGLPPVAAETPAPAPAVASETTGDLDDEGVPYSETYHAKTKTKVASTIVKNGKAWRMKKGVDKAAFEAYKKPYIDKLAVSETPAPAPAVAPGLPPVAAETPVVAPGLPGMPPVTVPGVNPQQNDINKVHKDSIVNSIHRLTNELEFQHEDVVTIFSEEFKLNLPEGQLIFGGVADSQYPVIDQYFKDLLESYLALNVKVSEVFRFGGEVNASHIQTGLVSMVPPSGKVGSIYYQDLPDKIAAIDNWHGQWKAWAAANNPTAIG